MNMNYEEFKNLVKEEIKKYLPKEYESAEVEIADAYKTNGKKSGIRILKENQRIAPMVYLEEFYKEITEEGMELEMIMKLIAKTITENEINENVDLEILSSFEAAKEHIVPRLINKEMNEERIRKAAHVNDNDLAITFHIILKDFISTGESSVMITEDLMNQWEADIYDIVDAAYKNVEDDFMIESMADIIKKEIFKDIEEDDICREALEDLIDESSICMKILSNKSRCNGAYHIYNPKAVDKILNKYGECYVLPSSIHEVILIPIKDVENTDDLKDMIAEVNNTQVSPEERLSYNLYKINSTGLIELV